MPKMTILHVFKLLGFFSIILIKYMNNECLEKKNKQTIGYLGTLNNDLISKRVP